MRFPVIVKHRRARATIYGRSKGHPYYRVAWHAGGKRAVRSFATYGAAKEEAERVVRGLAQGSQTPALSAKDASSAIEEFITLRAPLAEAKEGKRPARSPVYLANVSAWLRELAAAFPGSGISDLSKQHLDAYFTSPGLKALAPKSRNDRRAALKMFLAWAVKKDWLPSPYGLPPPVPPPPPRSVLIPCFEVTNSKTAGRGSDGRLPATLISSGTRERLAKATLRSGGGRWMWRRD